MAWGVKTKMTTRHRNSRLGNLNKEAVTSLAVGLVLWPTEGSEKIKKLRCSVIPLNHSVTVSLTELGKPSGFS